MWKKEQCWIHLRSHFFGLRLSSSSIYRGLSGIQLHLAKYSHIFSFFSHITEWLNWACSNQKCWGQSQGQGSANSQCKLTEQIWLTSCICQLAKSQQPCAVHCMVHRFLGSGYFKVQTYRSSSSTDTHCLHCQGFESNAAPASERSSKLVNHLMSKTPLCTDNPRSFKVFSPQKLFYGLKVMSLKTSTVIIFVL